VSYEYICGIFGRCGGSNGSGLPFYHSRSAPLPVKEVMDDGGGQLNANYLFYFSNNQEEN
jgi:hypothetical protein